jgi:hypothetical protein
VKVENLKAKRNTVSAEIAQAKRNKENADEMLAEKDKKTLCDAISFLFAGDSSLSDTLCEGTKDDAIEALKQIALYYQSLFKRASLMAKSVSLIAAKPKI